MNSETKVRIPWSEEKKERQRRYNKKSYAAHPERYKRLPGKTQHCEVCDCWISLRWISKHRQTPKHKRKSGQLENKDQQENKKAKVKPVDRTKLIETIEGLDDESLHKVERLLRRIVKERDRISQ